MSSRLKEIFEDMKLVEKIKRKLPHLFTLAEIESSRAGKAGMEVGSLREKILIALLIYKFGEENIETQIPITEPELDVKLFGQHVSIKTISRLGGVKIIWTVDPQKGKEFLESYIPKCDSILIVIRWGGKGGLYYIPVETQRKILDEIGRESYIKLPKPGTNPRGIEISKEGLLRLTQDKDTKFIEIFWQRSEIHYNPYNRWVDYWKEG